MAAYREKEDLISIGAYQPGSDPLTDAAIAARGPIDGFLKQYVDEPTSAEEADLGVQRARAARRAARWSRPSPWPTSRSSRRPGCRPSPPGPRCTRRSRRST